MPTDHVPPPSRCERLADIASRWGGSVEIAANETRTDYALPAHVTEEVREFFSRVRSAVSGPDLVARIPGGRVAGSGIVLSPDGAGIARDVSLDFGQPDTGHWLLSRKSLRRPQLVSGTVAVIASTLASGYSHWLLDELPRLLALDPVDQAPQLIAHTKHEFSRTALALYGWKGGLIEPKWQAHRQCEQLIVPSLVGFVGRPTVRAARLLNAFVQPLHTGTSVYGERLYLSREATRRRRITNESALWAELESRGFVKLRLEEMPWREQINAFRQAKVIVAPHGAGLANLVFCRAGTRVVELFNREYVNACFWRLAAVNDLDYRPLVPMGDVPLSDQPAGNRLDIEANIPAVLAALND